MKLQIILLKIDKLNHEEERICLARHMRDERPEWELQDFDCYAGEGEKAFLITDSRSAADQALKKNMGFAAYLNETGKAGYFPEALYCIDDLSVLPILQIERMYLRYYGRPWTILETKRCILREITTDDVDALFRIYEDGEVIRYMDGLSESREEEIAFIREYAEKQYRFYEYGMWVVIRKEDGSLIGRAGIEGRAGFEDAEIGYVIAADCRRRHYAREVCLAVLAYAQEVLGMERLNAFVREENTASKALLHSLGFLAAETAVLQGTLHERYVWKSDELAD